MNQYIDFNNPYSLQALGRCKNEIKEIEEVDIMNKMFDFWYA